MKKQLGMSLSEVLISLFLASLILTLFIQCYLGCKRQYIQAEKSLAQAFDVQWVSDLLRDSIRRAGFTPCLGLDHLQSVDRRDNSKRIHALQIEDQPNSLIQVNRMNEHFVTLIKIQSPTKILVQNSLVVHQKRPIIIADCHHAEVHELSSVRAYFNDSLIILSKPLFFSYEDPVYVGEFLEEHWFIKNNTEGKNTLHYQLAQTEELTPLIHSLSIKKHRGPGTLLLEVTLGLEEEKTRQLRIGVRGL